MATGANVLLEFKRLSWHDQDITILTYGGRITQVLKARPRGCRSKRISNLPYLIVSLPRVTSRWGWMMARYIVFDLRASPYVAWRARGTLIQYNAHLGGPLLVVPVLRAAQ